MNNRFKRGRSVFTCDCCGRMCREAGQAVGADCCIDCYELAGYQNSVYDGATVEEITPARDFYFERCVSRGGDPERIKSEFSELWP